MGTVCTHRECEHLHIEMMDMMSQLSEDRINCHRAVSIYLKGGTNDGGEWGTSSTEFDNIQSHTSDNISVAAKSTGNNWRKIKRRMREATEDTYFIQRDSMIELERMFNYFNMVNTTTKYDLPFFDDKKKGSNCNSDEYQGTGVQRAC